MPIFCKNGNPTKWHYGHLQKLAQSGQDSYLISCSNQGRITLKDLTLINKEMNSH